MKCRHAAICRLFVKRCCSVICRLPGWLKTIRPLPPSKKMETMSRRTCARNCQIKAWANCRENVKLQHGPSAVKSSNYSMDHMAWNHQIVAWAICHEIVNTELYISALYKPHVCICPLLHFGLNSGIPVIAALRDQWFSQIHKHGHVCGYEYNETNYVHSKEVAFLACAEL